MLSLTAELPRLMSSGLIASVLAGVAGWLLPARPRSMSGLLKTKPNSSGVVLRRLQAGSLAERWSRRGAARRRRDAVVELCHALCADLRSGGDARSALAFAAEGVPDLEHLVEVARSPYGNVPGALSELARLPGAHGLVRVAVCWQVCERSGAGLAIAVERLATGLRDEEQVRRETAAQLAGPKATGVLLALLPVFGLAMGEAVGADPANLLRTPFGAVLGGTAALLELLGVLWMSSITRRAMP